MNGSNAEFIEELTKAVTFTLILLGNEKTFEMQFTRSEVHFLNATVGSESPQVLYREVLDELRSHYRVWLTEQCPIIKSQPTSAMGKIVAYRWFQNKPGFYTYFFNKFLSEAVESIQNAQVS